MPDIEEVTETSDDSLHADLSAGFADFGTETPTESTDKAPAADATAQVEKPVSGEAEKAPLETVEPPKHWADADKALFAKAPKEIQQRWLARETEQQKGLDAKFQEIAGFKREREQLDELFSPLSRDLELNGISRVDFTRRMLGVHNILRDDPKQAFRWLAEQYGFDLSTLNEQEQQNPQLDKLMKGFQGLETRVNGFVSQQTQAEQKANLDKVEGFATAKDDKGNLLRPHFDEVAADILLLVKSGAKDLDAAYNKAIRLNDAVWQKVQAESKAAEKKAADIARLNEINKAKRAGAASDAREVKNGSSQSTTLRQELEAGFANF